MHERREHSGFCDKSKLPRIGKHVLTTHGLAHRLLKAEVRGQKPGGKMEPSRITAEQAKYKIDHRDDDILFIDTRNEKAWAESDQKLPGAIRIPVDEIELHTHKLPRDRCIVTYCT
jgi:hypothetical protein